MKRPPSRRSTGFTLIEMALAMALSLGIAATIVALLQQQVSFAGALGRFHFLQAEAPQINTLLATLVNKADSYRIYGNRDQAIAATGAVTQGGRALRLRFRNPDGTASQAIVAFEAQEGQDRLNFYFRNESQTTWPGAPSWTISSAPAQVDFSNDTGILLVAMTGPNGEQITFAGNPD